MQKKSKKKKCGRKNLYASPEEREASMRYDSIKERQKKNGIVLNDHWLKEDFIRWYIKTDKRCYYCLLSKEEIALFHDRFKDRNKRGATRGKTLEIDRKNDGPYTEENCVFACYYCNNAKSDIFSAEEFKIIGKAIARVIRARLKDI